MLKPEDVSVIPGNDALMTCIAYSTVDFNMTWYRHQGNNVDYAPLGSKAKVFTNGSALVRLAFLFCAKYRQ